MVFQHHAIGFLVSPFKETFGVPRQSLMMSEAKGFIKLNPEQNYSLALHQLETFSHIWLIFVFHKSLHKSWHPLIETPRVDAAQRIGVFATRSPLRPNSIGISAVKLEAIDLSAKGGIEIHVSGLDLLDGTPILDIKPYLPYADLVTHANSGWIKSEIERFSVDFSAASLEFIDQHPKHPRLKRLIEQMLELDPRPTSQRRAAPLADPATVGMKFAFRILDFDVRWIALPGKLLVQSIVGLEK